MTAYIKIFFSALLLAGGFGLASLFGPPKLADQFADVIRPPSSEPRWGALQPLDSAGLNDPAWQGYASTALAPPQPFDQQVPAGSANSVAATAPHWMANELSPAATPMPAHDEAIFKAVAQTRAQPIRDDYAVAPATWRDTSAPVGWPTSPDITPIESAPTQPAALSPQPAWGTNRALPSSSGAWLTPSPQPFTPSSQSFTPSPQPYAPSPQPQSSPNPRYETWPPVSHTPVTPVTDTQLTPLPPLPATPATVSVSPLPPNPITPLSTAPLSTAPLSVGPLSTGPLSTAREPLRHIVADGDTLARLAQRYLNDPLRAGDIFVANQQTLTHPDLLPIGAELMIPSESTQRSVAAVPNVTPKGEGRTPFARLLGPQPVRQHGGSVGR